MDEQQIKLHARLAAIEYMLAEAFVKIYGVLGVSEEQVEASHEELRQVLRIAPVPSNDPALNDLIAAELEEAHIRLLQMIADALKGSENRNRLSVLSLSITQLPLSEAQAAAIFLVEARRSESLSARIAQQTPPQRRPF